MVGVVQKRVNLAHRILFESTSVSKIRVRMTQRRAEFIVKDKK